MLNKINIYEHVLRHIEMKVINLSAAIVKRYKTVYIAIIETLNTTIIIYRAVT